MLVNKEIARKLRDIGYFEYTDYLYNHYGEVLRNHDMDAPGNQFWINHNLDGCDAPDKSDVFAWFRKKGIFGVTHPMLCGNFYSYVYHDGETFVSPNPPHDEFETWEEAEDACILKMIELHE